MDATADNLFRASGGAATILGTVTVYCECGLGFSYSCAMCLFTFLTFKKTSERVTIGVSQVFLERVIRCAAMQIDLFWKRVKMYYYRVR